MLMRNAIERSIASIEWATVIVATLLTGASIAAAAVVASVLVTGNFLFEFASAPGEPEHVSPYFGAVAASLAVSSMLAAGEFAAMKMARRGSGV